jgi:uncharacterized protein (TIGR00369 family)
MTIVPNPADDPFIAKWNDFYSRVDDVAAALGLEPVSGDDQEVSLRMPWRKEVSQPGGMFSAPSLYGLADICGTFLAMSKVEEGRFPLAVQSSVNLVGNTTGGNATARSTLIKAGRTLIVTDTKVRDDEGRVIATVITTYVIR